MLVILDNGHGKETKGKQSPDGSFLEYEFNRDIVARVHVGLNAINIESLILVPELYDVNLPARVARANTIYSKRKDAWLLSIHANAGGGTGWEGYTSVGDTGMSDDIMEIFYNNARKYLPHWRLRKDTVDGDQDKEANFYIIAKTNCPAGLTESGFMDNPDDLIYIKSDEGRERIALMHIETIKEVYEKYYKHESKKF